MEFKFDKFAIRIFDYLLSKAYYLDDIKNSKTKAFNFHLKQLISIWNSNRLNGYYYGCSN